MKVVERQLDTVAALLREQSTLSLATTGPHGEPWATPLFYIADADLTLYWLSSPKSLHSLNLARNPRAAASVYRSTARWREICGVQMRGTTGRIVEPARRRPLLEAYCRRFELGSVFRLAIRRSILYAFQPEFIRYIDNAKGFGSSFELTRLPEGWSCAKSAS